MSQFLKKALFLLFLPLISLQALQLDRVILATNDNELYVEFWPVVAPLWKKMGLQPTLAYISDKPCQLDISLGDVIQFPPIPGVTEALQAQAIRLFLPMLFPEDGCLIADIDMLPISRSYFFEGAHKCPDDAFLVYRDKACPVEKTYPMCYVAAKGKVFADIFDLKNPSTITERLKEWSSYNLGWSTDEKMLLTTLLMWEALGGHVFRLGHVVERRLDRVYWHPNQELNIGLYIDCHCPRPYSKHKDSIDPIVEAIDHEPD